MLFTAAGCTAFSQTSEPVSKDTVFRRGPYTVKASASGVAKDTILPRLWEQLQERAVPDNGMPNAITTKPAPDIYEGNNGKGQDIYRAQLDNMAILKPDSTFNSHMRSPGGYRNQQGGFYKKPDLRELRDGINKRRYPPAVPHIRVLPKQPKYPLPKKKQEAADRKKGMF